MKQFKILAILIMCVLFILTASACTVKKPNQYTLVYMAGEGGKVTGEQIQIVDEGADAETVTAVPNDGYEFIGWSDGVQEAKRTDTNVKSDIDVVANFSQTHKLFALDYKFGTAEKMPLSVKFSVENFEEIDFPVPEREHFTFGGWYCGETQVTGTDGKMIVGDELLQNNGTEISAKWTADETFEFNILVVYVTRINFSRVVNGRQVNIDYTMNDVERRVCEEYTKKLDYYLDDMLDGLVDFNITEYYTTQEIVAEDFKNTSVASDGTESLDLYACNIPEIAELLDNFDRTVVVYNLQDYDDKIRNGAGSAFHKYALVHFETFDGQLRLDGYTLEELLNPNFRDYVRRWELPISVFIHELIHTIEERVNTYDWHEASWKLNQQGIYSPNELKEEKYYFLHEVVIDGRKVGVPFGFWKGDIVLVQYKSSTGTILANRQVVVGEYITFTDIDDCFVQWSDGVTTRTRTDLITETTTFVAIYE